ncbi:LssY C-terminal domain-containing protein [Aeromicrobium wangtongii]|uniref:LssY C-terminal domain-containing protein n=1 Tax=Aeromicrobium wangtongii TaxID=2969247 RepID=UPI002016E5EB|nr:LssY C-terminal domain-containing protein [Aeromicrobium wangtongii]MCL3819200.1 LssY C-terminal domain-containing protein [Aeromicrobium wangtongii]
MVPERSATGPSSTVLDGWFFALSAVVGLWFSYVLLRDGLHPGWPTLLLVVFWIFFSYLVLPRLHRILTAIYLPDYFIGRTRTSDGLLGDPVNLGLLGREGQVHTALSTAGWTLADPVDLRSSVKIVLSVLRGRSYAAAPVSPLHLFDRQQDFAYEQEVRGSPSKRHHVRFWRCPDGWLLPGGFRSDWMAAATFDSRVGLSLFTLQVTHHIDENTDVERDFVVDSVRSALPGASVSMIKNFSSGYHHVNGGGDRIRTDGDLPILDVRAAPTGPDPLKAQQPAPRWPSSVLIGAGVALARGTGYVIAVVGLALDSDASQRALAAFLVIAAAVDAVLAVGILSGRNWARLLLMTFCSVTALAAMADWVTGDGRPDEFHGLLTVGGSVLVILALSAPAAREYAEDVRAEASTAASAS